MTKTKTILGLSLVAVFAVSMIAPVLAADSFLTVTGGGVGETSRTYHMTIDTAADIPRHTSVLGGYGWFLVDSSDFDVFAITTHNVGDGDDPNAVNDVRDSKQNPDSWHAHLVKLDGTCITEVTEFNAAGIAIVNGDMKVKTPKFKIDGTIDDNPAFGFHIVPFADACENSGHPLELEVQLTP